MNRNRKLKLKKRIRKSKLTKNERYHWTRKARRDANA